MLLRAQESGARGRLPEQRPARAKCARSANACAQKTRHGLAVLRALHGQKGVLRAPSRTQSSSLKTRNQKLETAFRRSPRPSWIKSRSPCPSVSLRGQKAVLRVLGSSLKTKNQQLKTAVRTAVPPSASSSETLTHQRRKSILHLAVMLVIPSAGKTRGPICRISCSMW